MSDETTLTRARLLDNGTVVRVMADGTTRAFDESKTDWSRVVALTDDEVERNAVSDPDSAPETHEEIAAAWGTEYVQQTRSRLRLTQAEFSDKFHIPLGTLRDWERGVSVPDTSARTLLRVIAREPEAVLRALAS